jgi:hypothetical protein
MSVRDGPGEGTWSVFAQKVVEERDEARAELAALKKERVDALGALTMIDTGANGTLADRINELRALWVAAATEQNRLERQLEQVENAIDSLCLYIGVCGTIEGRPLEKLKVVREHIHDLNQKLLKQG